MAAPNGLRIATFALTAVGAIVAGFGTTLSWISLGLRADVQGVLDSEFAGLDLAEGVAVLILAALALLVLMIVPRPGTLGRRWGPVALIAIGLAITLLIAWTLLRAEDRAVDELAGVVSRSTGLSVEEARRLIRTEEDFALDVETDGAWVSLAGGALVILGGATAAVWRSRGGRTRR